MKNSENFKTSERSGNLLEYSEKLAKKFTLLKSFVKITEVTRKVTKKVKKRGGGEGGGDVGGTVGVL